MPLFSVGSDISPQTRVMTSFTNEHAFCVLNNINIKFCGFMFTFLDLCFVCALQYNLVFHLKKNSVNYIVSTMEVSYE